MGISACSIALLLASLGLLFDYAASVSNPNIEHRDSLTVHIRKGEGEKSPGVTTDDRAVRPLREEQVASDQSAELQQELASVDTPELPVDLQQVKDWHAIAGDAAKASVDEYFSQKETRVAMWQQSRSVMFQPADEVVVTDKEPILADIRFKYRSRVVGLGINIGSCFFGVPIAGVPVEKRSMAITIFVCG
jgi:hypothetical protein